MSRSRRRSRTGTRAAVAGPMTTKPTTTEAKMSNDTTQHTPANVRERVAKEVYLWEATRFGSAESWALRRWREESNTRRELYFNVADRILALLRNPRGEGERVKEPTQAQIDEWLRERLQWVEDEEEIEE